MTTQIRTTDVNLAGLLEVLSDNLYSTPVVAVRELIQNSYDATIRRSIEATMDERPKIRLRVDID